jgi:glucose/arabinose dehydrogenase
MRPWRVPCGAAHATISLSGARGMVLGALVGAVLCCLVVSLAGAQNPVRDPAGDWEVAPGFRLDVAADGFEFPTAIAFVPNPGRLPDDPRFFVAELQGRVKVVTNDGTVHLFADGFTDFRVSALGPVNTEENGTAGLCLNPAHGYVFATYVYRDSARVLRNAMVRFETTPQRFAIRPTARRGIAPAILGADSSTDSHQIGPCQVINGLLYVTVGDGHRPERSHDLQSSLGKVLRMTVDGDPAPGNPYGNAPLPSARPYVWASGLRCVFGFSMVRGRFFAAENGEGIDRFLELHPGEDSKWDGNDWSLGMNATMVFAPAVSPVNTEYLPGSATFFPPEYRDRFYVALAGAAGGRGPGLYGDRSIVTLDIDFATGRLRAKPAHFVRYLGTGAGGIVGLAVGPDGLYFAPLFPDSGGTSPVYRVWYAPDRPHPNIIGRSRDARTLIATYGCLGCHRLESRGGLLGPALNPPVLIDRLRSRLGSREYLAGLRSVDTLRAAPFNRYAEARHAVAAARGLERTRLWLQYRLLEPKFDTPEAQMPNLGLSEDEARIIADYLVAAGTSASPRGTLWRLPQPRYRHVGLAFIAGFAGALVLTISWRRRQRRS